MTRNILYVKIRISFGKDFLIMWQYLVILLAGYIVGSINISVLITKYIGKKDIRAVGSGNAGGTNVARAMGAKWGIAVIIIDILKGVLIGLFAKYVFPADHLALGAIGPEISGAVCVFGVLIGNIFPCFFGFKGGKGVTTCAAVMTILDYKLFLILLSIFLITFFISRMVSLGSILASLGMPISVWIIYKDQPYWWVLVIITGLMAAILILRHKENIKRIINGTENKFKLWKKD